MQFLHDYFKNLSVTYKLTTWLCYITCILLSSCAAPIKPVHNPSITPHPKFDTSVLKFNSKISKGGGNPQVIANAEANTATANAKVLKQGRIMVTNKKIVRGGCWDYINAIWNKAGFPPKKRRTVFKSAKTGPYARAAKIQSGDWLYFINHSYGNIEHSAMFIAWEDEKNMQGYMLSYAGERKKKPARYKVYDLSSVYQVIRPKE